MSIRKSATEMFDMVHSERDKTAPESAGNTHRSLTHSLDYGKEGLMPNHTNNSSRKHHSACHISVASAIHYQASARAAFEVAGDLDLDPFSWISTTCGNSCLNPDHLYVRQPVRIEYPRGVCVYCGWPAGTKDHLVPRAWTGETRRNMVAVVPACADCNSLIGSDAALGIHERRKIAHKKIRKRYRTLLNSPRWTAAELDEFGHSLRQHIENSMQKREVIESRLDWPFDPFYDMRAWQKSGIDDPVAVGAIAPIIKEAA